MSFVNSTAAGTATAMVSAPASSQSQSIRRTSGDVDIYLSRRPLITKICEPINLRCTSFSSSIVSTGTRVYITARCCRKSCSGGPRCEHRQSHTNKTRRVSRSTFSRLLCRHGTRKRTWRWASNIEEGLEEADEHGREGRVSSPPPML